MNKTLGKDLMKMSIKIEFWKKLPFFRTKTVGSIMIPLHNLQGIISYDGTVEHMYKGSPLVLHVELNYLVQT
jgi:hypothetical protein